MKFDREEITQLTEELEKQLNVLSNTLEELSSQLREKDLEIIKLNILVNALKAGLLPPKEPQE